MDLFGYCYNVVYVLIFTVALSVCFMTYGVTRENVFQYFGQLMLAYIFDSVFVAISSAVTSQHLDSPMYFVVMAMFTGVELYLIGRAVGALFDGAGQRFTLAISIAAVLCILWGAWIAGDFGYLLDMTTFNFACLILAGGYLRCLRQSRESLSYGMAVKFRGLIGSMAAFSALAIVENVVYVLWAYPVVDRIFPLYKNHISLFSDFFCLVLSVWLIVFCRKDENAYTARKMEETLQQRMNEFEAMEQEKQKKVSTQQITEFCRYYNLTERETEILRLVLAGKTNQEISQLLFITVGTVKAHIHSIFSKLEVSRRSQLMTRFVSHEMGQ